MVGKRIKNITICLLLFFIIFFSGCSKYNDIYAEEKKSVVEWIAYLQNLTIEERINYCKKIEEAMIINKQENHKINFNVCLSVSLTGGIKNYDKRLCDAMYEPEYVGNKDGSISVAADKNDCYANIAKQTHNMFYCKNRGVDCLLYSVLPILENYEYINCEVLTNLSERDLCIKLVIGSKYGIIFKKDSTENEFSKHIQGINRYYFNKFGTIENLCRNMAKDIIRMNNDKNTPENNVYDLCIESYTSKEKKNNADPVKEIFSEKNINCNIKGNISYTTQEKIYHLPGCENYNDTEIDVSQGERWFCNEQEAKQAGWRKAYNCD